MRLSDDLRQRVIEAVVLEGASRNKAAKRFRVSVASAVRWVKRYETSGKISLDRWGGDRRSGRIEAQKDYLLGLIRRTPDITLLEMQERLEANCGERFSLAALWRFFARRGIAFKKTAQAQEQQRSDVRQQRWNWFCGQIDLDPSKLIFIDETGVSTKMARTHGRCRRGRRLRAPVPHGHYKMVTLVAGLRLRGLVAPKGFDRPINAASFEEWIEKCLAPTLSLGDIVIMDNLSSHKGPRVKQLIEAAGAELRYLPPYSPDMNPIEKAWSKLKAYLRKIAVRTLEGLVNALETCSDIFQPDECENYFKAGGYNSS